MHQGHKNYALKKINYVVNAHKLYNIKWPMGEAVDWLTMKFLPNMSSAAFSIHDQAMIYYS